MHPYFGFQIIVDIAEETVASVGQDVQNFQELEFLNHVDGIQILLKLLVTFPVDLEVVEKEFDGILRDDLVHTFWVFPF